MIKKFRIWLWEFVSDLERRLYPYGKEDNNDFYYTIKNPMTGEEYMIIEWIKSFDERIAHLQEEMIFTKSEIKEIKNKL